MSDAELLAVLTHPRVDVYSLDRGGAACGLLELDRREEAGVELAFEDGARRFHLHTCSLDHPKALAFYLKSGFRAYKRAIEVGDDPRLTGKLPRGAAPAIPLL